MQLWKLFTFFFNCLIKLPCCSCNVFYSCLRTYSFQTKSSAVAKRPRDASCLSVVSFVASIVQYLKRSFFKLLVTSAPDLLVHTIRFCSVVFSVTSSLAVIHTIYRDYVECAWSLSRLALKNHGDGDFIAHAWRLVVEYSRPHPGPRHHARKPDYQCAPCRPATAVRPLVCRC